MYRVSVLQTYYGNAARISRPYMNLNFLYQFTALRCADVSFVVGLV